MCQISAYRHTKEDGTNEELYILQDNLDDQVTIFFISYRMGDRDGLFIEKVRLPEVKHTLQRK